LNLLLDTCTFLWLITGSSALSQKARDVFQDPANEVYLSSVSVWEMMIKYGLGRLSLPDLPERFIPVQRERHGIDSLDLVEEAVLQLYKLPHYHRDPFDRMLICQAQFHGYALLTPDEKITAYPVRCIW